MSEAPEIPALHWDTADRLRKALRFAGMSVGEMSDYLGVSRNTVGRYINGHVEPDRRTLRLWALRCGVPMGWLQFGEEPKNPDIPSGIHAERAEGISTAELKAQFVKRLPPSRLMNPHAPLAVLLAVAA